MTFEKMITTIKALGADASYRVSGSKIRVDLNDFEGFDEDWDEIMRDYDDPEAVSAFEEMLEAECLRQSGDFYTTYYFEGFSPAWVSSARQQRNQELAQAWADMKLAEGNPTYAIAYELVRRLSYAV